MKIEISWLAPLVLIGRSLLPRIAMQGVERAVLSTAIEYGLGGLTAAKRRFRSRNKFASSACVWSHEKWGEPL